MSEALALNLRQAADILEHTPHGPVYSEAEGKLAGEACIKLCGGNRDQAITLWKLIQADLGYFPHAAVVALVRAANTENLVPDVTAPEPT